MLLRSTDADPAAPHRAAHAAHDEAADASVLAAYRNDPEVAKYQDWMTAVRVAGRGGDARRPGRRSTTSRVDQWVQVAIEHEGVVVGDLGGRTWRSDGHVPLPRVHARARAPGQGVRGGGRRGDGRCDLRDTDVHRIVATLDPQNFASMRVIEPLGFEFEGVARKDELVRGEWLDDMRFALLREDREAWLARDRHAGDATCDLREITVENDARGAHAADAQVPGAVRRAHRRRRSRDALHPGRRQRRAVSIPWYRGIYADDEPVGFMMTAEVSGANTEPYLWRLLVDRRHQGRGIGRAALRLLIDRLRAGGSRRAARRAGSTRPAGPSRSTAASASSPTGEIDDGEIVARLVL